jgi:hypothetical protein
MAKYTTMDKNFQILIAIEGIVVHGKGLGRYLGIPTANIDSKADISQLEEGVYSSKIYFDDVVKYGTVNIGRRPTVDNLEKFTIEVNILDFNEDIYGKAVMLEVYKLLRPTQRFDSLNHLIRQIRTDSLSTLDYFGARLKDISFDLENSQVTIKKTTLKLEEKALSLVFLLALNHDCTFTYKQLYEAIWHEAVRKNSATLVQTLIESVNTQAQNQLVREEVKNQSEETRIQLSLHF